MTSCRYGEPPGGLQVLPWICPMCEGRARWESGERCMECAGYGLVAERPSEVWGEPKRARRPTGVCAQMCKDCAYREGAPEEDEPPPLDRPFYCHQSTHATVDGYQPVLMFAGLPVGEKICAAWYLLVTGQELDDAEFVDTHPHGAYGTGPA